MDFIEFNKLLKSKKLASVYLLKGTEEYLMDKYIENVRISYIDDNFRMLNYVEIDINGNFDDILNSCETLPFMSEKKLVLIKDIYEMIQLDKTIAEKLNDYLEEISSDIILLIKDKNNKLKKNTRLYKTLNRLGGVVEFNRLNRVQLKVFIKKILARNEKKIYEKDLDYFIDKSNYLAYRSEKSLFELENELLKIVNHSEAGVISREDIEGNLVLDLETSIFTLIDRIMLRDTEASLIIFNNMYKLREPVPRILYMLIRHYRLMIKYMTYSKKGYRMGDIGKKLDISSFELKKIDGNIRRFSEDYVRKSLEELLNLDKKQKTSSLDEKLAMETLIVKLTKIL